MSVINTNISSLVGLNNLRLTNLGLQTSLERLSSGLRINKGADDPSGLAIAKGMEAQIGGLTTATQNAQDGISLIHTADGTLSETQDVLMRMRDLAVRGGNDATLTTADRIRLQNEFSSLISEINRKAHATTFNTKVLFSGMYSGAVANPGLKLQIGPDNGTNYRLTIKIPSIDQTSLGLSNAAVSFAIAAQGWTASAAMSCITLVNSAINQVSNVRAMLGIQENRLNYIINDLSAQNINISAAKSRIYDADMASEISQFTKLQILQQTGTAILAQANAQPQSVLQLLK